MKIGVILNSNEPETVWNTFRFGVEALEKKHLVKIFLLGKGVECENLKNKKFNTQKMIKAFKRKNGLILACGTCMEIRKKQKSKVCSISTINDLLKIVKESDKILTFG